MNKSRIRPWLSGGAVIVTLALLACSGGSSSDAPDDGGTEPGIVYNPNGSISGTVIVSETAGTGVRRAEVEPNDTLEAAQALGVIRAGDTIMVRGQTSAIDGDDPFDGYELLAPERVRLDVRLAFTAEGGASLELGLFDPISLQLVQVVPASASPTVATFTVRGAFHLIVTAVAGNGDYHLSVTARRPDPLLSLEEAGMTASDPAYFGELPAGDRLVVGGGADTAGGNAGLMVSCPAACHVIATVAVEGGEGARIRVSDATSDLRRPSLLAELGSGGGLDVAAGTLLHVEVTTPAGSGPWTLDLEASPLGAGLARVGELRRGTLASFHQESSRWARATDQAFYGRPTLAFVPGEALVAYTDAGAQTAARELEKRGGAVTGRPGSGFARVTLDQPLAGDAGARARATLAWIATLKASPGVAYAEPNFYYHAFAEPNDEHYDLQWHYPLIHLDDAWEVTTGSAAVTVAVIDTGRTNHPDLTGRQSGGYDFISNPSNALDGDGMDADPTDPGDQSNPGGSSSFHGTHVAGTIGAATNNSTGVAGCTWSTTIMHCRVLGRLGGTVSDISDAIRYAARLSNGSGQLPASRAQVINMSLGGGGFSNTMQNAVTAARNAGVVIFAAAGNESSSAPSYPAAYAGVVSVAAVDLNANAAPYSNFGSTIDLAAPGGDTSVDRDGDGHVDGVLSTLYDDSRSPARAIYAYYQGTSMACPHAAGVAALVLAVSPTLTPSQLEAILTTTADDLGAPGRDNVYGHGLVNARAAVLAAQGGGTGPPELLLVPPSLNFGNDLSEETVQVANLGGGLLEVQGVTTSTVSGGNWLTAATEGAGDATRNIDAIRVTVTRVGLDPGYYEGTVFVTSNGGNQEVAIAMSVEVVGPLPGSAPIYVQLVSPELGVVLSEVVVTLQSGLTYEFRNLRPDGYYVVAGTDLDGDGEICGEGEYCGAYPVFGGVANVIVQEREHLSGVDFVLAPTEQVTGGGSTAARR